MTRKNVTDPVTGPFIASAARVRMRRPSATWWQRLVDWAWPPMVRYGSRATIIVEVNGAEVARMPLGLAPRDRAGSAWVEFSPPLWIQAKDKFSVAIEFGRGVPATMLVDVLLDGSLLRKRLT